MTYDEYRLTFSVIASKEFVIDAFIKPKLSQSAYERCKYGIIQGLKYWRVVQEEESKIKTIKLQFFNPNQP